MTITTKNSGFDLVYTLTPTQIANTITAHPTGFFYLVDKTDGINLGNNTIVQTDYANINVSITNSNQLVFLNRFIPSLGAKELQIQFNMGSPNYYAYNLSEVMPYQSTILTAPFRKQNVQWNITEKTTCFDFTYTLSDVQLANTQGAYSSGVFYLYDNTSSLSLGNNTLVQDDYANINIVPVNKVLTFQNRVLPSLGPKQVHIRFWTGSDSQFVYSITVTPIVLPFESTYQFASRGNSFDLTYTLSSYQIASTISRFPNGNFYLNDSTDGINLGNRTNVQSDTANINVSITDQNKLIFLNRAAPSVGIKNLNVQFYVGNIGLVISESFLFEMLPYSNICFPADTLITSDQGTIPISNLYPGIHTLHKKKIVAITKTLSEDNRLVCFEKNALYPNVPSQRTSMTGGHCIFYKGHFIPAKYFIGIEGIHEIEHKGAVYNVLMEEKECMLVNSLLCETLHPQNKIAQLFSNGCSLQEYITYYEDKKQEVEQYCKLHRLRI